MSIFLCVDLCETGTEHGFLSHWPACGTSDLGLTASAPLLLLWEFSFYSGYKSS